MHDQYWKPLESRALAGPGGMPHRTFYRGVSDVSHRLLPAAFRPIARLFSPPHIPLGPGKTNREQIERELQTLAAFIEAADRQGHQIPEDSQELRDLVGLLRDDLSYGGSSKVTEWPPSSFLSVLALAQHYGVPTRLLDWSLDPYVLAFKGYDAATIFRGLEGAAKSIEESYLWPYPRSHDDLPDPRTPRGDRCSIRWLRIAKNHK